MTAIRNRRTRAVRKLTLVPNRLLTLAERAAIFAASPPPYGRPKTRADCAAVARPCPYVACSQHLYLDVTRAGNITLNFPDLEPGELAESCALDVAERGGATLAEVGRFMNLVRERARQIEARALSRLARTAGPP